MAKINTAGVDTERVKERLDEHKTKMKLFLKACAHCTLCAESCFLYMARDRDPKYTPSYKFINSIGLLYKQKKNLYNYFHNNHLIYSLCLQH